MKKSGTGKKIAMAILVIIVAIAAFSIVGVMLTMPEEQSDGTASEQPAEQQEAAGSEYYDVAITGADVTTDSQGGQALVVTFDYTNKTNTAVNFMQAVTTTAFQDGVAMGQDAYVTDYTGADGVTPDYMLKVEPNATATVHIVYALAGSGNVRVVCTLGFVDGGYPDPSIVLAEQEFTL